MSKKHFIELADCLKQLRPDPESHPSQRTNPNKFQGRMDQWNDTIDELCAFCRCQNHNFNESRFRDYINGECGPSGGKINVKAGKAA